MSSAMDALLAIMRRLRDPDYGCPWDLEQDFRSIAPYTIEEAYEVADAIERDDYVGLQGELGDLLLQVVFHSQMAREAGYFDFDDVASDIGAKMIRRHPHVFGAEERIDARSQSLRWEELKAQERENLEDASVLADVGAALPAWLRARKLQSRAARVGFDWSSAIEVLPKLAEELDEVCAAMRSADLAAIEEEVGDLLFVVINLARKLELDADRALRLANAKFERRFRWMEQNSASDLAELDARALDALWERAKLAERGVAEAGPDSDHAKAGANRDPEAGD